MHRFYVAQKVEQDIIGITDVEQLHHIRDVLRLKVDDEIIIFDNKGNEYTGTITELDKKQAVLTLKASKSAENRPIKITVACALPKKGKIDEVIDNLTQLGVDRIIPMTTKRVIVRLEDSKKAARLQRWRKIAQSAAQQSQRNSIPLIEPITSANGVLARSHDFDLKLIPTLSGKKHIKEVLAESKPSNILVLIGPEGDFSPQEIELAKSEGFIPVSLGNSVLRVDTAAIAVASYINLSLLG